MRSIRQKLRLGPDSRRNYEQTAALLWHSKIFGEEYADVDLIPELLKSPLDCMYNRTVADGQHAGDVLHDDCLWKDRPYYSKVLTEQSSTFI